MKHFAQFLLCCLLALPASAQRGGMRGGFGGFRGGFAGGGIHHGGFAGGFHGGFVGSGFGGFRGFGGFGGRHFFPRNRLFFGASFGFFPWAYPSFYPYPYYSYPYYSDPYYSNPYYADPPAPQTIVIYPSQAASPPVQYYAPPSTVPPEVREYPESAPSQKYEKPIYLIAFNGQDNIRAAEAYWVEDGTLHYVTLQHERKQAPLDSVDRAFSYRLNRERHVDFRLPEP